MLIYLWNSTVEKKARWTNRQNSQRLKMYSWYKTAHRLADIRKWTADFLLPNHIRHSALSLQLWGQALVRSRPGHPATTLGKTFHEGKLGCVQDMQLFLCARGDLGGASRPFRGLLTAWCRGHVHRLAHGIGNYAETHGWPEARYSAQRYWVRPELLTDTPSAFKSLFTVQNQLDRLLSQPTPCL